MTMGELTCNTTTMVPYHTPLYPYLLTLPLCYQSQAHITNPGKHDFIKLRPNFGYAPVDRIKHTLSYTTQFARRMETSLHTKLGFRYKHFCTTGCRLPKETGIPKQKYARSRLCLEF